MIISLTYSAIQLEGGKVFCFGIMLKHSFVFSDDKFRNSRLKNKSGTTGLYWYSKKTEIRDGPPLLNWLPVVSDFTCSRGSYRYQNLKSSSKTTGRLLKPPARHENDSNRTLGSRPAGCCSIRRWSALQENWRTPPARPGGCYHLYHQLHVIAYTREIGEFY